jgi:hypothetical protein
MSILFFHEYTPTPPWLRAAALAVFDDHALPPKRKKTKKKAGKTGKRRK